MRYPRLHTTRQFRDGYTAEESCIRWCNYYHLLRTVVHLHAGWLPRTAPIDVKVLFGIHLHEDANFARRIHSRLKELGFETDPAPAPCAKIREILETLASLETWQEYAACVYGVIKPGMIDAWETHFVTADPLLDEPSTRLLAALLRVASQHINGGMVLVESLIAEDHAQAATINRATSRVRSLWCEMGSDPTHLPHENTVAGNQHIMAGITAPARESFCRVSDGTSNGNGHGTDTNITALLHECLHAKILAAEIYALTLHEHPGFPCELHEELTRQVWDAVRHARAIENMMNLLQVQWGDHPVNLALYAQLADGDLVRRFELLDTERRAMSEVLGRSIAALATDPDHKRLTAAIDYFRADDELHARQEKFWFGKK
ncbi:hypothetical protein BH09SUM1_BH09SUM1_01630 [soil metagenome]